MKPACKSRADGALYPSIDLHCPEDGVSSQGENALWSLESSEKKIKISKRFCNYEVARRGAPDPANPVRRTTDPSKLPAGMPQIHVSKNNSYSALLWSLY